MSIRLAIFDLDGTVLDTIGGLYTSVNKAREAMGLAPQSEELIMSFIGRGAANLMRQSLSQDDMGSEEEVKRMMDLFNSDYNENCISYTKEYPGIKDILVTLKESGLILAVNSNKNDYPTQKLIKHFFGEDLFSYVSGRKDDVPRKPDPAGAIACMDYLSCRRDETVYIGDSDVDIETAANGGFMSVSVCWGYQSEERLRSAAAKIIIHKADELCRFLQKEMIEH